MQSSVWLSVVLAGISHVSHKALRVSSTSPLSSGPDRRGYKSGLDEEQPYPLELCQARREHQDDGSLWQIFQEVCRLTSS
jgi:hypothetical protein